MFLAVADQASFTRAGQQLQSAISRKVAKLEDELGERLFQRGPLMAECKAIFAAPTRREMIQLFREWFRRWQVEPTGRAVALEKD